MSDALDTNTVNFELREHDDPTFVTCAARLIAAAAMVGGHRDIWVVHIDNWFGKRWLGFPLRGVRRRLHPRGIQVSKTIREPTWMIPPFNPNRVLSEKRYELRSDGVLLGPFETPFKLHREYEPPGEFERSFARTCAPGIYAWYSGNTTTNDRAALMVYAHTGDDTGGWYTEFRISGGWRLSTRTVIGAADWCRLIEVGHVTECACSL